MNKDKKNIGTQIDNDIYLIMIGIRSLEYGYIEEVLYGNIDYFKRCNNFGLSPYKALMFLGDYLRGEYNI